MIDRQYVEDIYECKEVQDVMFIRYEYNTLDGLKQVRKSLFY